MRARSWRSLSLVILALTGLVGFSVSAFAADEKADHGSDAQHAAADGDHAADAASHGAAGHGDHQKGVPMDPKKDLVVWSMVTFLVFLAILRVAAWKPLSSGLNARESQIQKNITDAETARVRAEQMLADHERKLAKVHDEVKGILDEARRDAETARQTLLADAARDAEATRKRAVEDIERAKNQALDELFDVMSDRVLTASEHVIGRSLNEGDQSRLVQEALVGLGRKN